jgi:hypothetical protein
LRPPPGYGGLFPIANIPLNAFGFTTFEALLRQPVDYARSTVRRTVKTTVDAMGRAIPGREAAQEPAPPQKPPPTRDPSPSGELEEPPHEPEREFDPLLEIPGHSEFVLRRTLVEVAAIPAALAFTIVATPLNYVYVQGYGLWKNPFEHVMDTLAQLPVVEIPVDGLSWVLGRDVPFGQRSKGFFELGPVLEPVGRLLSPTATGVPLHPPVGPDDVLDPNTPCGLVVCDGLLVVDLSDQITHGTYGENLANPLWDYTLGWLDPIGAHGDYRNPRVIRVIATINNELVKHQPAGE